MWLDIPTAFKKRHYDTFLDVGAFDGDTLRFFHQRFGCQRGIAVEANESLFDSIRKVASLYPRGIDIMPKAAWSSSTRLRFEEVRFGMIQVTESPVGQLDAAPIDYHVHEQVDCLKMDIEGAEGPALEGCNNILKRWQPDLAIAAYHQPEDLVALYAQIEAQRYGSGDFSWHFGHYSDCLDDSIFYVTRNH
jgi:FkbM family methyltransferase